MSTSPAIFTSGAFASRRATDLQIAWMDAADDASEAYAAWRFAQTADQADGFVIYRAALDREEAAARALEREVSAPASSREHLEELRR
jgi:hypothetical protein